MRHGSIDPHRRLLKASLAGTSSPDVSGLFSFQTGEISRVIYFNEETGDCLLEIKTESKDKTLLKGRAPLVHRGQQIEWNENEIRLNLPISLVGTRRFLKSGALPGVGPKLANVLAQTFAENFFSILEKTPSRLREVPGVGPKKSQLVQDAWRDYKARLEFFEFLAKEGLPLNWVSGLWPFYGSQSLSFLKNHPYQTVNKHQFSFEEVDAFALKQGFHLESPERLHCGFLDILQTHSRQGHCAYPEKELSTEARARLECSQDKIEEIIELELVTGALVSDTIGGTPCLYLKELWELERSVAKRLAEFRFKETPWGWFNTRKVLSWAQALLNVRLAPLQQEAIETALGSSLTVITGGPGTGKTTLLKSLTTILQLQHVPFALCSPTGRAAQRLGEATGVPAQTLHRLLKYDASSGKFLYDKNNRLNVDLALVDEASMLDLSMMSHLLEALPKHAALILVGDADQLPSVGAGAVLQSLIQSHEFPVVTLTDIFRQKEDSLIKINAARINSRRLPLNEAPHVRRDFHWIQARRSEQAKKAIFNLVTNVIPREYGIKDPAQIQILVPMNKGSLGTQRLNSDLQRLFNAHTVETPEWEAGFKVGDKVMITKNDYRKDVFNGDIGFVRRISTDEPSLDVEFESRTVRFGFDERDHLTLAYAISIHKSQGSEYPVVIIVLTEEQASMAQRHLIYTAVTRGTQQVFLVADPATLQKALQTDDRRWQKLTDLLTAARRPERGLENPSSSI